MLAWKCYAVSIKCVSVRVGFNTKSDISTACTVDCMEYAVLCVLLYSLQGTVYIGVINAKHFRDKLNVIKRTEILSLVMSQMKIKKNIHVNTNSNYQHEKIVDRHDTCMINSSQKKYRCEKLLHHMRACRVDNNKKCVNSIWNKWYYGSMSFGHVLFGRYEKNLSCSSWLSY